MSNKRRNTSSPECDGLSERQYSQHAGAEDLYDDIRDDSSEIEVDEQPQINANTGQAGAFPGLGNREKPFYGPANDGIDYLRMVRSEAQGIPHLLRAQPVREAYDQNDPLEEEDDGGYWDDDGTYTARPDVHSHKSSKALPAAQLKFYDSLLVQFSLNRATMRCVPPLSAIEKLTSAQPISFPPENRNARTAWNQNLKTKDPSPVQIACMDDSSIFELIRLVTTKMRGLFQSDDFDTTKRIGAWLWAVLGKCPDRGELGGEEVSDLRRLAQKAIDTRAWLEKMGSTAYLTFEQEADEEDSEKEGGEIDAGLEAARTRLAQATKGETLQNHGSSQKQGAKGTPGQEAQTAIQQVRQEKVIILDMILTLVGEVYGQRDLLESRAVWPNV